MQSNVISKDPLNISLKNWLCFLISGKEFPIRPHEDFMFDFAWSDLYSLQLEFKTLSDIQNTEEFYNKIDNSYFGLESNITKVSDIRYDLTIKALVKQKVLPKEKASLLWKMKIALDKLNNFSLKISASREIK